jgi:hypothetical protein
MKGLAALRNPSPGATPWNSPRKLLLVGVVLVAVGIGEGLAGSHHSSRVLPAAPTSSAVGRWESGLRSTHLLTAGGPLRSRGSALVRLPASLSILAIRRVELEVDEGSVVMATGIAKGGASAAIRAVRIALTPAGRALLLGRPLAHATAVRLRASLSGSGGSATHSLAVTIPR